MYERAKESKRNKERKQKIYSKVACRTSSIENKIITNRIHKKEIKMKKKKRIVKTKTESIAL